MMNCQKCQKEYIPKRIGGLFCSVSCGNSYRQQLKRDEQKKAKLVEQGLAIGNPLTEGESSLWAILSELGRRALELNIVLNLPMGHEGRIDIGSKLATFVGDCKRTADNPIVQEIGARMKAQQQVEERNKSKQ
ncbi:MAG: hypothetical protein EOO61_05065 [Hymenobacter sp.]|nr:MAG: hypothetical protein EOO61_05065 [Hymenobacter sp.]